MDHEELIWQELSKAFFGARRTTDEGLFTYRVMETIRVLSPQVQDAAWHRFLRWAVLLFGAGVASLVLAIHTPAPSAQSLMATALFQSQTSEDDPLSPVLENF